MMEDALHPSHQMVWPRRLSESRPGACGTLRRRVQCVRQSKKERRHHWHDDGGRTNPPLPPLRCQPRRPGRPPRQFCDHIESACVLHSDPWPLPPSFPRPPRKARDTQLLPPTCLAEKCPACSVLYNKSIPMACGRSWGVGGATRLAWLWPVYLAQERGLTATLATRSSLHPLL